MVYKITKKLGDRSLSSHAFEKVPVDVAIFNHPKSYFRSGYTKLQVG